MEKANSLPEEYAAIRSREIYRKSSRDYKASLAAVCRSTTPNDVLIEIGQRIPFLNPEELAPLLVSHPKFTDELLETIVKSLKAQWWGNEPIESRIGWETLERERTAYLQKVEELSRIS